MTDRYARDIVVIGGSSGALRGLRQILRDLPKDFSGTLFIVQHVPGHRESYLADILARESDLPIQFAESGMKFKKGSAYIAPPDHHLLVDQEQMILTSGPKENRARPAIDPLFRSAAVAFGSRAVGVILSGLMDDGTAGCLALKDCGSTLIVEDPEEADFAEMPNSVLEKMEVDIVLPINKIASHLVKLAKEVEDHDPCEAPEFLKLELDIAKKSASDIALQDKLGHQVPFVCPECEGPLWEMDDSRMRRYRCHTGHAYSLKNLGNAQSDNLEKSLWAALRTMEEQNRVLNTLAKDHRASSVTSLADTFQQRADEMQVHVDQLKQFLLNLRRDQVSP